MIANLLKLILRILAKSTVDSILITQSKLFLENFALNNIQVGNRHAILSYVIQKDSVIQKLVNKLNQIPTSTDFQTLSNLELLILEQA